MFLANSLNNKLKRSFSDLDIKKEEEQKFPYTMHQQNPFSLFVFRLHPEYTSEELQKMTDEEFFKKFTIDKLHQKWEKKLNVNFDLTNKKFSYGMSERAKTAKAYVKDLIEKDLFETKKPRWNISTKTDDRNFKPPLKKTLFNLQNGLMDYHVVPLKEKFVNPGIDIKYELITDSNYWNKCSVLGNKEKKKMFKEILETASFNSQKYWKNNEENRINSAPFNITEARKKIEKTRYFKPYKDPLSLEKYNYKTMNKVKDLMWIEREKVFEDIKSKVPRPEKNIEKVNALVHKKMSEKYKEKFDIITGKKTEKKFIGRPKSNWKDIEIAEKIQTIADWKDINWYKPSKTEISDKNKRIELLKPLVNNKFDVLNEERKIKEEKQAEAKKKLKLALMKQKTEGLKIEKNTMLISKYPIEKNIYEYNKQFSRNGNEFQMTETNGDDDIISDPNNILNEVKKDSNSDLSKKIFLDAYKNVILAGEKMQKQKRIMSHYKDNKIWIENKYYHTGTFREFIFTKEKQPNNNINNTNIDNNNNNNINNNKNNKNIKPEYEITEKFMAWSCCMNRVKESRGCHCEKINKHRWNLDNA